MGFADVSFQTMSLFTFGNKVAGRAMILIVSIYLGFANPTFIF